MENGGMKFETLKIQIHTAIKITRYKHYAPHLFDETNKLKTQL